MQAFKLTPEAVWYGDMSFSPDGRWLGLSGKPLVLLDTTDGRTEKLPLGNFRWGFTFARGGAAIAYLPESQLLCEYDLTTRQVRERKIEDGYAHDVVAAPGGETLYLSVSRRGGSGNEIRVLDARTFEPRGAFGGVEDDLRGLALSADGRWLAATAWQRVRAWPVGDGNLPARAALCATPKAGAAGFALSADGGHLAVVSSSGLEIWATDGGERVAFSGKHRRGVTAVACSPTKPVLATGDNAGLVFLWDHAGRVLTRYDWGLRTVRDLRFAPDGLRCAAVGETGKVVIWDVDA